MAMAPKARGDALCAQRYLSFREFKLRRDEGWFWMLHDMSQRERLDRSGSTVLPIYGPLEEWESPDQYEDRFADWLRDVHKLRLERVYRGDPMEERKYRQSFAWSRFFLRDNRRNAKRPRETQASADSETNKKRQKRGAKQGCRSPLVKPPEGDSPVIEIKRDLRIGNEAGSHLSVMSKESSSVRVETPSVGATVDPTPPQDLAASITQLALSKCAAAELTAQGRSYNSDLTLTGEDPIESRLWYLYSSGNTAVLQHESAVQVLTARLFRVLSDAEEIQRLRDEIDGRHAELRLTIDKCSPILASLVAYVWRHEVNDARLLIQQARSRDSPFIQRASHRKCAEWAAAIKAKQSVVSTLSENLNSTLSSANISSNDSDWMEQVASVNDELVAAEQEIRELREKRRQELNVLLHFDKRLRLDVEEILRNGASA